MTYEELKQVADEMGYKLIKKPDYDCSCYCEYPNPLCKFKNGRWKCVDKYEPVEGYKPKYDGSTVTHCRLKGDLSC